MFICLSMWGYVHLNVGDLRDQKKKLEEYPRAGVTVVVSHLTGC